MLAKLGQMTANLLGNHDTSLLQFNLIAGRGRLLVHSKTFNLETDAVIFAEEG